MSTKSISSIRLATRNAIARCRSSDMPLTALAEFADRLLALGWDSEAVHEVEKGVLFALLGIAAEQHQHSQSA